MARPDGKRPTRDQPALPQWLPRAEVHARGRLWSADGAASAFPPHAYRRAELA